MSFLCKSCGELIGDDESFSSFFIPALNGRVCMECHNQIHRVMDKLSSGEQFTIVDEDGNIVGIVLDIMHK